MAAQMMARRGRASATPAAGLRSLQLHPPLIAAVHSEASRNRSTLTLRDALEAADWMQSLPQEARERILSDAHESYFREGEVVARKGEPAHSWIGVAEGLLKISAVYRTGKVVMFTGVPEGSWIGEGSVIKRELRRYDILAMRPTRVIHVPGSTFRWLLDVSIEFNHAVIARLNERLAQYIGLMEIDRLSDPVARVARCIGTLYNPILSPRLGPALHLSHTELGEMIGMSRKGVSTALRQLESEGLVHAQYGTVSVRNLPRLVNYEERDRA